MRNVTPPWRCVASGRAMMMRRLRRRADTVELAKQFDIEADDEERFAPASSTSGKYPPAKPGALECEPLKAVGGVADAAP